MVALNTVEVQSRVEESVAVNQPRQNENANLCMHGVVTGKVGVYGNCLIVIVIRYDECPSVSSKY